MTVRPISLFGRPSGRPGGDVTRERSERPAAKFGSAQRLEMGQKVALYARRAQRAEPHSRGWRMADMGICRHVYSCMPARAASKSLHNCTQSRETGIKAMKTTPLCFACVNRALSAVRANYGALVV